MKVAICTPIYSDTAALYTARLVEMILHTIKARPDIEPFYVAGSGHLIRARNEIAQMALKREPDFLLWIDADMTFPPHALLTLLGRELSVVGCNCTTRVIPPTPTARRLVDGRFELVYPDPRKIAAQALEPVAFMGLAFCLVSADVMRRMGPNPFQPHPEAAHGLGEDRRFFECVHALGEQAYVDHALSQEIGHVTQTVSTLHHVREPA